MNNKIVKSIIYAVVISVIVCSIYSFYYIKTNPPLSVDEKNIESGTVLEAINYSATLDRDINQVIKQLKLSPDNSQLYHKLGMLYERKGLFNMAITQWEKAAQLEPHNADFVNDIGRGYYYTANYTKALELFRTLVNNKRDIKYKINMAYTLYKLGELDNARDLLIKIQDQIDKNSNILTTIANTYIEQGNYTEAVNYLEQAKKANPRDYNAFYNSGIVNENLKSYEKALADLKYAYELDKSDSEILLKLGEVSFKANRPNWAIEYWLMAVKAGIPSINTKVYSLIGDYYYSKGKVSEAIQAYKDSINAYSFNYQPYYKLGNLYYEIGQTRRSIEFFELAQKLNPGDQYLKFNLGNAYYETGRFKQATREWQSFLDKGIYDPYFNYRVGYALYNSGNMDLAAGQIKRALIKEPDNIAYHELLGNIYLSLKQFDQAIEEFNTCLIEDPHKKDLYYKIGKAYYNFGNSDQAITYLNLALDKGSKGYEVYDMLGNIYFNLGDLDQALFNWKEANRLNSNYQQIRIKKAQALLKDNKIDEALKEIKITLAINPDNTTIRYELAMAYYKDGDIYKAINQLNNILQLEPDHVKAKESLALYLIESGDKDEATRYLQDAVDSNSSNLKLVTALAEIKMANNNFAEAAKLWGKAVHLVPSNIEYNYNYGLALKNNGQGKQSIASFKKVVSLAPASTYALKCKEYLSILDNSSGDSNTSLAEPPVESIDDAYNNLIKEGEQLLTNGDIYKAIEKYKTAIKERPLEITAYQKLADTLKIQGRDVDADKIMQLYYDRTRKSP